MGYYISLKKNLLKQFKRFRRSRSNTDSTIIERKWEEIIVVSERNDNELSSNFERSGADLHEASAKQGRFDIPEGKSYYEIFQYLQLLKKRQRDPCRFISAKLALTEKLIRYATKEDLGGSAQQGEYEDLVFYITRLRKAKKVLSKRKTRLASKQLQNVFTINVSTDN
ncbi:unnamed protein product [Hermetia illucens]|uniref:Uncharacterized protein n=1 Tax=Hermetia illucens TaxID=343691 RepID=A0A7R8YQG4_HERIL|nr:unnamed protein product [Hermetia illucens]